jgi:hypothetical protein
MNKKFFCSDSYEEIHMVIVEEKGHKLPTTMARRCLEKNYLDFTYIEL